MAVADAYATVPEYRLVAGNTDRGVEDAIRRDLLAVSRMLDLRLRRHFNREAAATEHLYTAPMLDRSDPDQAVLFVDDIASTSGLVIKIDTNNDGLFTDEDALASTDYRLFPLNAATGPEARPWTSIRLTPSGDYAKFPAGVLVSVTAIHGWPSATPPAIKAATLELTRIFRLEGPRGLNVANVGLEQVETLTVEARRIVSELVRDYQKVEL